jgi:hypothetical protein
MEAQGEALIAKLKPLFEGFAELVPLVRTMTVLTPIKKARALELCKLLPEMLHRMCPTRGVTVKAFMIYFEMHDFIKEWDTIGLFNEDAFEARHALRKWLKRRFASIRCIKARDQCMNKAYASLIATRPARDVAIELTRRKKGKCAAAAATV